MDMCLDSKALERISECNDLDPLKLMQIER